MLLLYASVVTACTPKRVLAIVGLLLPSAVFCLIATFALVFWDIGKHQMCYIKPMCMCVHTSAYTCTHAVV